MNAHFNLAEVVSGHAMVTDLQLNIHPFKANVIAIAICFNGVWQQLDKDFFASPWASEQQDAALAVQ